MHEDLSRAIAVKESSDRSFGLVFAAFFAVVGTLWLIDGDRGGFWWLVPALITLAIALLRPRVLAPFSRLWLRFGRLLSRVTTPIVMGVLFLTVVTPIALLRRAVGSDPLRLKLEPTATTYWIPREPPGPAPETMMRQF